MNALRRLPTLVGLGTIGYFTFDQAPNIYYHFINRAEPNFADRYGSQCYGIVTGGSYGLGKDYANELAKRGFNVILVARGKEGLEKAKAEINEKYPKVDVQTLQFDFTSSKPEEYEQLLSKVSHLDVGILINNVGTYLHGPFHEDSAEAIKNLLITNTFPVSFLTRGLLDKFSKREKRSLVMTVSSEAGDYVHPTHPSYGSSKCYDSHLTRGLQQFYKGSKLDISLMLPGPTKTPLLSKIDDKFSETPYGKAYCAESDSSASNSFRKISYQPEIIGDTKHHYFHFMYRFLRPVTDYLYTS